MNLEPWQVRCGDSMDLLDELPPASVDLVLTDPPYSSGGMMRGDRTIGTRTKYVRSDTAHTLSEFSGDNRDQRSYVTWCDLWMRKAMRAAKPGAIIAVWTDWRQLPATTDAIQVAGWVWRGVYVWGKRAPRPIPNRPQSACEFVVWGTNGARDVTQGPASEYVPGWVEASSVPGAERRHMTEKPVDVLRPLARLAPVGGVILDPFTGSGSTGVAALAERRKFIGFELSAENVAIASARLEGRPFTDTTENTQGLLL